MPIQKYYATIMAARDTLLSGKSQDAINMEYLGCVKDAAQLLHKDGMWPIEIETSEWVEVPNSDPLWAEYTEPGWAMYYTVHALPNETEVWQEVKSELLRRGMAAPKTPIRVVV